MSEPLRIGIVGAGYSRRHIEAYHSLPGLFEVRAICDVDLTRAQALAQETGAPGACASLEGLLKLKDVDVVDIVTPSHTHFPLAMQALAGGKHVILEKPAAASLRQVDELIAVEKSSGRRLMPIFQYRFWNGLQKLKHLAALNLTGRAYLSTVETSWRRREAYYAGRWHGKWATELGGPSISLAIHAHDVLYYVLGPARSVFARAKTLVNPIETEDTIAAALEMADGSLATLAVTTGSSHEVSRHRFCFSNLSAESNNAPYSSMGDPWVFTGDSAELQAQIDAALLSYVPQREGFAGQFERYARAMQSGAELPVTLQDARNAIELVTAVYASARENRLVDLPISREHPMYAGWF